MVLETFETFRNKIQFDELKHLHEIEGNIVLRVRDLDTPEYEKTVWVAMTIPQAKEILQNLRKQIEEKSFLGKNGAVDIYLGCGCFGDFSKESDPDPD